MIPKEATMHTFPTNDKWMQSLSRIIIVFSVTEWRTETWASIHMQAIKFIFCGGVLEAAKEHMYPRLTYSLCSKFPRSFPDDV